MQIDEIDDVSLTGSDIVAIKRVIAVHAELSRSYTTETDKEFALVFSSAAQAVAIERLCAAARDAGRIIIDHPITIGGGEINTYEQNEGSQRLSLAAQTVAKEIAKAISKHAKALGADPSAGARK